MKIGVTLYIACMIILMVIAGCEKDFTPLEREQKELKVYVLSVDHQLEIDRLQRESDSLQIQLDQSRRVCRRDHEPFIREHFCGKQYYPQEVD